MAVAARWWTRLALLAAATSGVVLPFTGFHSTSSCAAIIGDSARCVPGSTPLVAGTLALLAIPTLMTAAPVAYPGRSVAMATAVLLTALALLGAASIGLFYLPAAVLAWFAVAAGRRQQGNAGEAP